MSGQILGVSEAILGEEDAQALVDVIRSGWISQGEGVQQFEHEFSVLHANLECVAVSNCTCGLHLILHALNIQAGDEVLVPGVTFIATINAVLYCGATPVPVDIQAVDCPHLDMEKAREALTPRTRAIMVMHYAGYRVNMEAWCAFAKKHNLLLIEDAAHCPGLEGVGVFSDAAVYSFFANKNMTTAEGGMIATRDATLAQRLRRLRGHSMSTPTLQRAQGHAYSYDVDELGFNYRLDDIRAALGRVQLRQLAGRNEQRQRLSSLYRNLLRNAPDIQLLFDDEHPSSYHLFPIVLPEHVKRQTVMERMREAGIQTSVHYPPYHDFTYHAKLFQGRQLPLTDAYCARTLTLPLHAALTEQDVHRIVHTLLTIVEAGVA